MSFKAMPTLLYGIMCVAVVGVAVFDLSFGGDIRTFAGLVYLVGFFAWFRYGGVLRSGAMTWMLLASLLIPILTWLLMLWQEPELAQGDPRPEDLVNKFIFMIPAFFLAGRTRNVLFFWSACVVAALALPWVSGGGWAEFERALSGRRVGYGINPIRAGMIYGTVFLGLLCLFPRLVLRSGQRFWRLPLWILSALLVGFMTVTTHTRGVYLSVVVLAFLAILVIGLLFWKSKNLRMGLPAMAGVLATLLVAGVFTVNSGVLDRPLQRTANEWQSVVIFLQGDNDLIAQDSIGLRLNFWVDAAQWSMERPFTGWGYRASRMVHADGGYMFGDRLFRTIHNAYLDVQLSYGLLGVALMAFLVFWLCRGSWRAWKADVMPTDIFVFFVAFMVFFGVNSLFTSSLFIADSVWLYNVVLAGFVSFVFRYQIERPEAG